MKKYLICLCLVLGLWTGSVLGQESSQRTPELQEKIDQNIAEIETILEDINREIEAVKADLEQSRKERNRSVASSKEVSWTRWFQDTFVWLILIVFVLIWRIETEVLKIQNNKRKKAED